MVVVNKRVIRPKALANQPVLKKPVQQVDPKVYQRNKRSIFLIMLAIPLVTVSSYVLYKRVILGDEKQVQRGEYTPDGGLRFFDKDEVAARDRQSIFTKIFGSEK